MTWQRALGLRTVARWLHGRQLRGGVDARAAWAWFVREIHDEIGVSPDDLADFAASDTPAPFDVPSREVDRLLRQPTTTDADRPAAPSTVVLRGRQLCDPEALGRDRWTLRLLVEYEREERRSGTDLRLVDALLGQLDERWPSLLDAPWRVREEPPAPSDRGRASAHLITSAVACERYAVSRVTIRRAVRGGQLTDHRPPDRPSNSPFLLDEREIQRLWPRRSA